MATWQKARNVLSENVEDAELAVLSQGFSSQTGRYIRPSQGIAVSKSRALWRERLWWVKEFLVAWLLSFNWPLATSGSDINETGFGRRPVSDPEC